MPINQFRIAAMTSEERVQAILRALQALPGVHVVHINRGDRSVRVEHPATVSLAALIAAIRATGCQEVAILA